MHIHSKKKKLTTIFFRRFYLLYKKRQRFNINFHNTVKRSKSRHRPLIVQPSNPNSEKPKTGKVTVTIATVIQRAVTFFGRPLDDHFGGFAKPPRIPPSRRRDRVDDSSIDREWSLAVEFSAVAKRPVCVRPRIFGRALLRNVYCLLLLVWCCSFRARRSLTWGANLRPFDLISIVCGARVAFFRVEDSIIF